MSVEVKQKIAFALSEFQTNKLFDNGLNLFNALGYNTERQQKLDKSNYESFKESFVEGNNKLFNEKRALTESWNQVHLLFQLTKGELLNQGILFDTKKVDNQIIEAYLFFAIELDDSEYTRTHLSEITREINKLFPMPVMILFKINGKLTLSVINRRLHKKDENKDVLEKITLIKDIDILNPHRGHIEILFDLSFQELYNNHQFDSFVSLHTAWQKTLDANELNKKFYQELANWYFWAIEKVEFPNDIKFHKEKDKDRQIRNSTNVIRLITRLIFTWFLKEKNLVPDELFDEKQLKQIINSEDKTGSTYYKAILQNLFFATLNTPMNADQSGSRKFIKDQHLVHTLYRYERFFINKKRALELFENIPFLNGGLFECLDKKTDSEEIVRLDCFSDNPKNEKRLLVPDELFFSNYQPLDLNSIYQTKNKKYKVRGLINILNAYKFTIHENTPIEEEVALDPELLGKVFENLLASYNPETKSTARKQTGSFYTPREVVNYMVDESLVAYFTIYLIEKQNNLTYEENEVKLKRLLTYTEEPVGFTPSQNKLLVDAIFHIKILDPACGSGAFPMGVLHKLVYVLRKIDKDNIYWRELQKQKAIKETEEAFNIGNQQEREYRLKDISDTFENNNEDYGRKLYLIENSIYGVDIQPIAVQISKLRFFISLIVDQKIDKNADNIGVRPLPNLETKFVAANTLIGIERPAQQSLRNPLIAIKEKELKQVREKHFTARTPKTKEKYRTIDAKLRTEIAALLENDGFGSKTTEMLANWNPYDQNTFANFFDTEWMFNFTEGFDLIIGNPPYISFYSGQAAEISEQDYKFYINHYDFIENKKARNRLGTVMMFLEKAYKFIKKDAITTLIIDINIFSDAYIPIRKYLHNKINIKFIVSNLAEFENVGSGQIILSFMKHNSRTNIFNYYTDFTLNEKLSIEQSKVGALNNYSFKFSINEIILNKVRENSKQLVDAAHIISGMNIGGVKDYFLSDEKRNPSYHKAIFSGNIFKYKIDYPNEIQERNHRNLFITFDKQLEKYIWDNKLGTPSIGENDDKFNQPKILLRRPLTGDGVLAAAYSEDNDEYCDVTVYIINEKKLSLKYLLAIVNSKLATFYCKETGIIRFEKGQQPQITINRFKEFPVKIVGDFEIKKIISIVEYILYCKQNKVLLDACSFFELLINSIIYEVYLPDAIKKADCEIIKYLNDLPNLNTISRTKSIEDILHNIYEILNDENKPVRKAMYFMDTIEEIAIIEGKKT